MKILPTVVRHNLSGSALRNNLGLLGDVCSVATTLSPFAPLPPDLEHYRPTLLGFAAAGLTWLFYSIGYSRKKMTAAERIRTCEPTVVIVGGSESKDLMEAITKSPTLHDPSYIKYKALRIDSASNGLSKEQIGQLEKADAIILMPEFRIDRYPETYRRFIVWARNRPEGIGRYRGPDSLPGDFPAVPFSTVEGIVNYAAEFLLRRATDRARYIQAKAEVASRWSTIATAALLLLFIIGAAYYRDFKTLDAMAETPSTVRHLLALTETRREAALKTVPVSREQAAAEQRYIEDLSKIQMDELVRIFGLPRVPALALYAPSRDGQWLLPIEAYGFSAYRLNAQQSVAACALRIRGVVFWSGRGGRTTRIRAWTFDGTELGSFVDADGTLKLNDGVECSYDATSGSDPKSQLVCLPTPTTDTPIQTIHEVSSMAAVLCVSVDTDAQTELDNALLRKHLVRFAGLFAPPRVVRALVLSLEPEPTFKGNGKVPPQPTPIRNRSLKEAVSESHTGD